MFLVLIITTLLSFLQSTVILWDLITPLILYVLLTRTTSRVWVEIFLAGLLADTIIGRILGLSSLIYLVIGLFLWIYQRKYYPFHPLFLFIFISGSLLITSQSLTGQIVWLPAVVWGIIFVFFRRTLVDFHRAGSHHSLRQQKSNLYI